MSIKIAYIVEEWYGYEAAPTQQSCRPNFADQEDQMAKNTGNGFRQGSVDSRTQLQGPNGNYIKRNAETGRFMDQKSGGEPFKGVAKERDGRRT